MKRKLDKTESEHRKAWRLAAYAAQKAPSVTVRYTNTPKNLRLPETNRPKVQAPVVMIDLRQRLADMFHGITYKGPYVHVTHRDAFLTRQTKRLEKERAKYVDGTPIVTELGEKV